MGLDCSNPGKQEGPFGSGSSLLNHNGVDVNIKNDHGGNTALIHASYYGYLEVVRVLLGKEGVDVNIKSNDGFTALIRASYYGYLEVVRTLLNHNGVDVIVKDNDGKTALDHARNQKKDDVTHLLEEHMEREKFRKEKERNPHKKPAAETPALEEKHPSSTDVREKDEQKRREEEEQKRREEEEQKRRVEEEQKRRKDEEQMRQKDAERKHSMEKQRRQQELSNGTPAKSGAEHQVRGDPAQPNENSHSIDDTKIEQDRSKLLHVMNTPSADPAELSLEYIERCIKKDQDGKLMKLGSGAYGDVFLAEDCRLPKKFAVKMINPTKHDQDTIEDIRKSFQTELSTLKRFRHPNIIVLYGYSLNPSSTQQCLVYEYAANGSLADFLHHHGKTARLSADIRLSIMFELARAVHFLHTGGCKVLGKGWKVFHRDIKSANICLAEDFSPRLIDCGLAKFVRDSNATPGAVTLKSTNRNGTFGTPGYMCPEYALKSAKGRQCSYIAACDVYSIGVVMVELVLGSLTGGQSTQNDSQFLDVYEKYVMNDHHELIVDGCEKLKHDADPTIIWNPVAIELVCKAAVQCMAPVSGKRLCTKDLLGELNRAIQINAGLRSSEPEGAAGSGCPCDVCNRKCASMKCSKGHALCSSCIENSLLNAPRPGVGRCPLMCLFNECSVVLQDEDLCRNINVGLFIQYILNRESDSPASTSNDIPELLKDLIIRVDAGQKGIK
ncbi:serine/threonine kinase [Fragilaria crotonensis]|nr:serine/threonine kinase [Fragilaria crotonensis]